MAITLFAKPGSYVPSEKCYSMKQSRISDILLGNWLLFKDYNFFSKCCNSTG